MEQPSPCGPDGLDGGWRAQEDSNFRPTAPEAGEKCKNTGKFGGRDGVVTAIVGALGSAAAREPQALSRCVEALGLALGALMESPGEDAAGADEDPRALPDLGRP